MNAAIYPPGRGQRHECTQCGRAIAKAKRVFMDMAFCDTCYAREFIRRPCSSCLAPAMLHKSQETGLCRKCNKQTRVCQRCERPVPRAALIANDKPVCPSCRRYFEPTVKQYKPKDHCRCSVCGKHRKPVTDSGSPLCALCAAEDRREEVAELEQAYWLEYLLREQASARRELTQEWCRLLFDGFVEHEVARVPAKALGLRLLDYVPVFQGLERRFQTLSDIDATSLVENYTPEELRCIEAVITFLHDSGIEVPTRDKLEEIAERRRIRSILASVQDPDHLILLQAFQQAKSRPAAKSSSVKTLRLSLRAASGLLQVARTGLPTQEDVKHYLKAKPGQRAALAAFVSYLNGRGMGLSLPRKRSGASAPNADSTPLIACLSVLGNTHEYPQLRASAAGVIIGLLGLTLSEVVRYPRSCIVSNDHGIALKVDGNLLVLDNQIVDGFKAYLSSRDAVVGNAEGFLFPGRASHQHVSEAAVTYHFKIWHISARNLATSGRSFLKSQAAAAQ